jgi:hypothetical protein
MEAGLGLGSVRMTIDRACLQEVDKLDSRWLLLPQSVATEQRDVAVRRNERKDDSEEWARRRVAAGTESMSMSK